MTSVGLVADLLSTTCRGFLWEFCRYIGIEHT